MGAHPLAAHVALDREHAGLVVELLGHVLADALQRRSRSRRWCSRARGGSRGAAGAPAAPGAWVAACRRSSWLRGLRVARARAAAPARSASMRLFEQALLLGVEGLALGGELQPLEHRHLVRELVDGGLLERDLVVASFDRDLVGGDLAHQRVHHLAQLLRIERRRACAASITERDRAALSRRCTSAHPAIALRSYNTLMTPASPMRCHGSPSTSASNCVARERQRGAAVLGPDELALVQSPRGQPDADAVVHEHLHAVGAAVGEQVGVVRAGGAEDVDHARQRRLGAGAHVQRLDRQPHRVDADHCSNSRIQAAQSLAAAIGQVTFTAVAPRRSSMRMSPPAGAL